MNSYFNANIASANEEEQYVAKFLRILTSLGEHAASFLFQKGVVLGDDNFNNYGQQLRDSKFRDSIINILLRSSDNDTDKKTQCVVAVMLFDMSKEAAQLFSDVKDKPNKTGTSSSIIALSHLMALIDRATAFLNLPSVNDKAYWRLVTLQQPTPPAVPSTSVTQPPPLVQPPEKEPAPELLQAVPASKMPQLRSTAPKSVMPPPAPVMVSPPPELSPKPNSPRPNLPKPNSPNPEKLPKEPPELKTKAREQPSKSASAATPRAKETAVKNPVPMEAKKSHAKKNKVSPPKQAESAVDKNKPEGPIKAMLRRIAEEIQDNSYEAILKAIKDETLMKNLYNTPNNPISVKITEVNTKERTVYLIKKKRGAPEPVTFRLIRKLITELQL